MKCDNDPTAENLNNPEILQTEYDRQYDLYRSGSNGKITSRLV